MILIYLYLISFSLILTNDSRDIAILRGKANDIFSFMYKPVSWLRSMAVVEEEAAVLREKNIQLKSKKAHITTQFQKTVKHPLKERSNNSA